MPNSKGHISAKHAPNSLPEPSLKSLCLFLSCCVEITLVSGFFMAQVESIYRCFLAVSASGIWARHESKAKQRGQRLIPKPRVFLISCGWKSIFQLYNTTEDNMCKFLYSTEETRRIRSLTSHYRHLVFKRYPLYCAGSNVSNFWRCVRIHPNNLL